LLDGAAYATAEDERRICCERADLIEERVHHVNRIKGLLFSQGGAGLCAVARDRRKRLGGLRTGDGRPLGPQLKAQIERELDRFEPLLGQIKAVEDARDGLLARLANSRSQDTPASAEAESSPVTLLLRRKGIGPELAASPCSEGLSRSFANRRQAGPYSA
jgi:transposase